MTTEAVLQKGFPEGHSTRKHHAGPKEIDGFTGNEYIFTTIRNPLDTIVSWYLLNKRIGLTNFIMTYTHSEIRDRLYFFLDYAHSHILFENLLLGLNRVMGCRCPETLPHINKTADKKHWWHYHSIKTVKLMWQRFPKDMELYYVNVHYAIADLLTRKESCNE